MQNIVIIDYGMGNISSVKKQLERASVNVTVSNDSKVILNADKLILPGVGHFKKAMDNLKKFDLIDILNQKVITEKTPVLGICLGMQLMANKSEEGNSSGLGWIEGEVVRMNVNDSLRYKIPHVGWNSIVQQKASALNSHIEEDASMYFVHAYKFVAKNDVDILHTTSYENAFISAVSKDNVFGVQYHPEKSQDTGLQIFKNFIAI
jgi:glutamine amidotransferase